MAHFAKIGLNNTVLLTVKIDNFDIMDEHGVEQESIGIELLKRMTGHETWLKCSFNTRGGIHYNGTTPDSKPQFRKNFPTLGWTYDSSRDAFIPPKAVDCPSTFVLDEQTCEWKAPVAPPTVANLNMLHWDNDNVKWIIKVQDGYFEDGAPRFVMPT